MLHFKYLKKINFYLLFSLLLIQVPVISQNIFENQENYSEEVNEIESLVEELFDSKIQSQTLPEINKKLKDE